MQFEKTVLKNGIRVVSEKHADSRCVVLGFWVEVGTRHEQQKNVGISHMVEHMVFKGTKDFSAYDIVRELEAVGGEINAFTGREHTCYHTTTLSENLDLSVKVLSQLVKQACFDAKEFAKEKNVVQQEILMAADDLEEFVYDLYFEEIFGKNPLGWPILGTTKSVDQMTQKDLVGFYKKFYRPNNIVISATGNIDHKELVQLVEKFLGGKSWGKKSKKEKSKKPKILDLREFAKKDCEQYHIIVGFPATTFKNKLRFEAYVLNTLLGGGMTSKLYQLIREKKGLVYSIFSMLNTFTDCGLHTIYAGTEKENVKEVIRLITTELKKIGDKGISKKDVDFYKKQAKGQILISAEDIDNRMNSLAVNEMTFGRYRSVDSVIEEIDKVDHVSVNEYVQKKLGPQKYSVFLMGPEDQELQDWLKGV